MGQYHVDEAVKECVSDATTLTCVLQIGADGRRNQVFLALSTAAEFRDHLSLFSDFYANLGELTFVGLPVVMKRVVVLVWMVVKIIIIIIIIIKYWATDYRPKHPGRWNTYKDRYFFFTYFDVKI